MTDKQNFEKDIDVPSKRLDRIDKMEIDLANYEQMERDIEKIIEPYQLDWELDCLSLPSAIQSILERKEQECEELKSDNLQEVGQLKFAIGTLTAENLHLKELLDMRIEALCDSCKAGSMLPIKCRIYEKTLTEIKEIARVNSINTCWTAINLCVDCDEIGECGLQSPFEKLKAIIQIISECEENDG